MFQVFRTIAASIFLEGLFFLLIGVLISGLIEVLVPSKTILRIVPKNRILALLCASLLGFIFPICECGIVPVIHRLLKKGVPLFICVTLLFSSPIVNIVVILSTYFAFTDLAFVVLIRLCGGILISIIVGFAVSLSYRDTDVIREQLPCSSSACSCHGHEMNDENNTAATVENPILMKISRILSHSIDEFFDTGKYFILGVLVTAAIQSLVPGRYLASFGKSFPLSNLFMLFFPYILSVCSNTDAFIARSFLEQFNISALVCFMVFGAMFDIKTTIMLKKIFRVNFIIRLLLLVLVLVLGYSFVIEFILRGNLL